MFTPFKTTGIGLFATSARLIDAAAQTNLPTTPASASAADTAATNQPTLTLRQKIKQPVSWLNWGGDVRVRNEYFSQGLRLNSQNH